MKKRTLAMLCAVVMLVTVALPLAALATSYRYVYTSNGKALNQRSAPITHANNRVGYIPYGAKVTVDSYVNNSTWAYVNYEGRWGYVMSRYLVRNKPAAKPASQESSGGSGNAQYNGFSSANYAAVVRPSAPGGFVNLRWGPSKSDSIQTRLYEGEVLDVISQNKSWAQVTVRRTGAVGFIMRAFLSDAASGS